MELSDLVSAILRGDLLAARQWVADASRERVNWQDMPCPQGLDERELIVAAGVAELLANRSGQQAPHWTHAIGAGAPLVLDPGLETMPRSLAHAREAAPEPLRKRNLFALPDFLRVA